MRIALIFFIVLFISRMCFGNEKGIIFDDIIVQINQQDSTHSIQKTIIIPPQPSFVSIRFHDTESNLQNDFEVVLRVQLSIVQKFHLKEQHGLNLTNLLGGEYTLAVKNLKTGNQGELKFYIQPIFWENWWFAPLIMLLIILLICIIMYLFFQYRLRQQLRTQIVRDTIARDLHDDIGSYLSSISILSQNVDNLILNNPEKARQSLTKIGETARQVMDTMGDIVWSINPTHDSMEQIVNRMKDFANELFFNQDIEINFQASDSLKKVNLTLERRRDFFLIYKESMTNIYKYAEANLVNVSLQYLDNQVFLKVEDNGKGFEMEQLPKNRASGGNGLKNMKVRAEKLNGKLEISSKKNQGTNIILTFEQ